MIREALLGLWARPPLMGAILTAVIFLADQLSKAAVLYGLGLVNCAPCPDGIAPCMPCRPIEVLPFMNLVMVWNPGVSFGMFPTDTWYETAALIAFSLAASAGLLWWLAYVTAPLLAIAIGLFAGGALGNVIDRMLFGAVADFFHLHASGYDWYVFNVADAAIVAGVGLLLVDTFFGGRAVEERSER